MGQRNENVVIEKQWRELLDPALTQRKLRVHGSATGLRQSNLALRRSRWCGQPGYIRMTEARYWVPGLLYLLAYAPAAAG